MFLYAFWSFIYMTFAFWGPENTNLKTAFKVPVFENYTAQGECVNHVLCFFTKLNC